MSSSASPRLSPPTGREMYFLFNHLHKTFAPHIDEPDEEPEEEEARRRKREPWRKLTHLPDYRKVKIGEYYEDNTASGVSKSSSSNNSSNKPAATTTQLTDCSEGESDVSARSSFESDTATERREEFQDKPKGKPAAQATCAGCATVFAPSPKRPSAIARRSTDSYELALHKHLSGSTGSQPPKLHINTCPKEPEKYCCIWPGCTLIVCKACAALMRTPKTAGGIGGSLTELQNYWAKKKETPNSESTSKSHSKPDGSITADIVQAMTSTAQETTLAKAVPRSMKDTATTETMKAVDQALTKIMSNTSQDGSAPKEVNDRTANAGQLDVSVGIVVTVKEVGLVQDS